MKFVYISACSLTVITFIICTSGSNSTQLYLQFPSSPKSDRGELLCSAHGIPIIYLSLTCLSIRVIISVRFSFPAPHPHSSFIHIGTLCYPEPPTWNPWPSLPQPSGQLTPNIADVSSLQDCRPGTYLLSQTPRFTGRVHEQGSLNSGSVVRSFSVNSLREVSLYVVAYIERSSYYVPAT